MIHILWLIVQGGFSYTGVAKMIKNNCERDMSCVWICLECQNGPVGLKIWATCAWAEILKKMAWNKSAGKSLSKKGKGHLCQAIVVNISDHAKRGWLKFSAQGSFLMLNHMMDKNFRNSQILLFLGIKFEIYHTWPISVIAILRHFDNLRGTNHLDV